MAASTNRILFAIVVLLFAAVLRLVTGSIDFIVFLIALVGLAIGFYGISTNEPHQSPTPPLPSES